MTALKRLPGIRTIVSIGWLMRAYHFSLAALGALIYWFPSRQLTVIGITGTNGKTTTARILYEMLRASGKRVALISSATMAIGDRVWENPTENTMPGRLFLQRMLRRAVRAGAQYAIIEVTSQGAVLHRHRFVRWRQAFLLNLYPEHIEAHGSFENYRGAKLSFLTYAAEQGARVFINGETEQAPFYQAALKSYDLVLYAPSHIPAEYYNCPLGATNFNRENIAAAVTAAREFDLPKEALIRALREFPGVPGRMQEVAHDPFRVVVDYAFTPNALREVYAALRDQLSASGRLVCVLGSASGGRDVWKRPELGKAAAEFCDAIVLTNEDPYDEDPEKIITEIEHGVRAHPKFDARHAGMARRVLDRREAIREALALARPRDTVVITGKGSERWIHGPNGGRTPWSDSAVVNEELARLQGAKGKGAR